MLILTIDSDCFETKLGEKVIPGNIIIRQRGRTYDSGENTKLGRDYTVYAVSEGWVKFVWNQVKKKQIVTVSDINPNIPKKIRIAESE